MLHVGLQVTSWIAFIDWLPLNILRMTEAKVGSPNCRFGPI